MSRYMNSCFIHSLDKNALIAYAITATKSYDMSVRKAAIEEYCKENFRDFLTEDCDQILYDAEYDHIEVDNIEEVNRICESTSKYTNSVAVLEMICCDKIEFNEEYDTDEEMIKALYNTNITSYDVDNFFERNTAYDVAAEAYSNLVALKAR